eukprot:scaffold2088_cov399-Prasinococcus_capsulatus_cf.AAC.41
MSVLRVAGQRCAQENALEMGTKRTNGGPLMALLQLAVGGLANRIFSRTCRSFPSPPQSGSEPSVRWNVHSRRGMQGHLVGPHNDQSSPPYQQAKC